MLPLVIRNSSDSFTRNSLCVKELSRNVLPAMVNFDEVLRVKLALMPALGTLRWNATSLAGCGALGAAAGAGALASALAELSSVELLNSLQPSSVDSRSGNSRAGR